MADQLQFDLVPYATGIQDRFEEFDREHPEVFDVLLRLALEVQARGFKRYGIRSLWERMRWHFLVDQGMVDFKLNDHFHSRYARKLVDEVPGLVGFFELRELKAR